MHHVFGEEKIYGNKFPREGREIDRHDDESVEQYRLRQYLIQKSKPANADEMEKKTRDMNPNGFWECQWSVRGIHYTFPMADELEKIACESEDDMSVCKIVSQGLIASDPRYISKVVYMMRHPRAVAKSQERLIRGPSYINDQGELINTSEEIKIHTPEMFIRVTAMAARWRLKYPDIPFQVFMFDELVENPDKTLANIGEFVGRDMSSARELINKKLRRSEPEDIDSDLWPDAEFVYEKFLSEDYQDILEYLSDKRRAVNRTDMNWLCPRAGRTVTENMCKMCRSDLVTRENFIHYADSRGIDWINEPCPYECGFNYDVDHHMTLEESVMNNFWLPENAIEQNKVQ
jgi:hypothetical protein